MRELNFSLDDWRAMYEEQGGCGWICRRHQRETGRLHVDHCHDSGIIRGLLCSRCNLVLGCLPYVEDLERAINYLVRAIAI
jgi:hypothetical protein